MTTCLQSDNLSQHVSDYYEDQIFCVAPGQGQTPVSLVKTEAKAFPTLFPDGKNSFDQFREQDISYTDYVKSRLLSINPKFSSNTEYIFYLQYVKELKEILSSAQMSLKKEYRKVENSEPITAQSFTNAEKAQSFLKKGEGAKYLHTIRGSASYWNRTMKELFAMVNQMGLPTFFGSFSAAAVVIV